MSVICPEIIEIVVDKIARKERIIDIARSIGVTVRTIQIWKSNEAVAGAILDRRIELIDGLKSNIEAIAFEQGASPQVRLKASMEMLKVLVPEEYDPRIRYQIWLDRRDERLQKENEEKARQAQKADNDEDPREGQALEAALVEMMARRRRAALKVAQQADDYEEAGNEKA